LVALAVVGFAVETASFTVAWSGKRGSGVRSSITAKRASADDDRATLNLYGEFEYKSSKTVPSSPRIVDFLSLDETPRILLRGTGKNEVARVKEVDDALSLQYEAVCRDLGLTADAGDGGYYRVRTAGVKFPGLQVDSLATIGVRRLTDGYEFVLVKDTTEASGIPLFVYFFNRVTGKVEKSDDDASSAEQSTTSVNRISYSVLDERVQFTSKANLSIRLGFPRVILKVLPGARTRKIEEKGGEALVSALEKDIPTALENLVDEYVQWLEASE